MTDDRAVCARALIAHRAPELTDADLAGLSQPDLPVEIAKQVMEVIAEMEARLTMLEGALVGETVR